MLTDSTRYPQYAKPDYQAFEEQILHFWQEHTIFQQSIAIRSGCPTFTFYEGPPSANGAPGIHHVMARAIKDLFCRYKTLKGFQVLRKAGWDTHGLPVELQVEKRLGITKKDIGTQITIADYNQACKDAVMEYTDQWNALTRRMGYWVDLENPYITYTNQYIESVWHLLKRLWDKQLIYKGYTIQPYSPAAGTGLSSHELNLPGCYKPVKDLSCVAMFALDLENPASNQLFLTENPLQLPTYFLAWTTTPWTLPANTALCVGPQIDYVLVQTCNPYTKVPIRVILAQSLLSHYFAENPVSFSDFETACNNYKVGTKDLPFIPLAHFSGNALAGCRYEQLLPFVKPDLSGGGDAFRVITGDFVTTEDGTGIVHIAPTFGADDMRVAKQHGIVPLTVPDEAGNPGPLVDKQGKFVTQLGEPLAGKYVKNYLNDPDWKNPDEIISIYLKQTGKAFQTQKYEHTYPHCWRTDKPILYYPLDSWFIKSSACKDRMVELNRTIQWKPESTGTGRFGNWLENLEDWNLSRSRYWGIPLPIWANADRSEMCCIGSATELAERFIQALKAKVYSDKLPEKLAALVQQFIASPSDELVAAITNFFQTEFDFHRPYIDEIYLVDSKSNIMLREADLIDVWFDSGAMPFAQWHYPFENQDTFKRNFPADFIAEGVDQTRGWFFTLHAIAVMLEDSVAYKNVIANGLVLDKQGNKMSKRLGNAVDPFQVIADYGVDSLRWYMIENAPPWENLKFDEAHLLETQRRFFGTLFNTYSFFALYANVDNFRMQESELVPYAERPELDRWILSRLYTLRDEVEKAYEDYDPTPAARAIQAFVVDHLSNWYVRLARRRFWKGEMTTDKKAAYETLFETLVVTAQLMSPIAPFISDWLYKNLTDNMRSPAVVQQTPLAPISVHLTDWPLPQPQLQDYELEQRMDWAQEISSLVHSIRKRLKIKVRQPLQKLLIPAYRAGEAAGLEKVRQLIEAEVNVKVIELITQSSEILVKKAKPNFKTLGPRFGTKMKLVSAAVAALSTADILNLEANQKITLLIDNQPEELTIDDFEIKTEDIPGWAVASGKRFTVALDITITDSLKNEGIARDIVNRLQHLRKELGFEVTDKIKVQISRQTAWAAAIAAFGDYITAEAQAVSLSESDLLPATGPHFEMEIDGVIAQVMLEKV